MTLTKNISAGNGLGSASSDAAATLLGLRKYLKLSIADSDLMVLAYELGSDVVFFLGGPLAFCTGKGNIITKISKKFIFRAILVIPDVNVSTAMVYRDYKHYADVYMNLNKEINEYIEKNRIDLAAKMCANMLETCCFGIYRELFTLKEKLKVLFNVGLCLSGSGSGMFFLLGDEDDKKQRNYLEIIEREINCRSYIVRSNSW